MAWKGGSGKCWFAFGVGTAMIASEWGAAAAVAAMVRVLFCRPLRATRDGLFMPLWWMRADGTCELWIPKIDAGALLGEGGQLLARCRNFRGDARDEPDVQHPIFVSGMFMVVGCGAPSTRCISVALQGSCHPARFTRCQTTQSRLRLA